MVRLSFGGGVLRTREELSEAIRDQLKAAREQLGLTTGHTTNIFGEFAALGLAVTVEDASNFGRVDMTVDFDDHIYIFEFKVVELLPDGAALEQIKTKGYANKYCTSGKTIPQIGVEFSNQQRQIVAFEVETI